LGTIWFSRIPFHTRFEDLHAMPHSPNPELKRTEPLGISATASSAFLYSLDPRLTVGVATDLQWPVCEKLLLLPAFHLCPDEMPRYLSPPDAAQCSVLAGATVTGAAWRRIRETVAIVRKSMSDLRQQPRQDLELRYRNKYERLSRRNPKSRPPVAHLQTEGAGASDEVTLGPSAPATRSSPDGTP